MKKKQATEERRKKKKEENRRKKKENKKGFGETESNKVDRRKSPARNSLSHSICLKRKK